MFRTAITITSTILAAAAIAVPVASTALPRTPSETQVFSLGTALYEYQESKRGAHAESKQGRTASPRTPTESQVFSLGTALYDYQSKHSPPPGSKQGTANQLGTGFGAPTATAHNNGFDWWAAAIGAGVAVGAILLIGGIGAMTIRARGSQTKLRTT
jgi:hypothetical protein